MNPEVATAKGLPAFRRMGAIRHRNYAWFWSGSAVSYIGDWMDQAALNWLVLQWTSSPLALGFLNFARLAPSLGLTIVGGLVADRKERRGLLLVTAATGLLATLAVGLLVGGGPKFLPLIYALAAVRGAAAAFERPVRQALIPMLVPSADLPSAIALHSTIHNLARIVGPALAGILIAAVGLAPSIFVNAASFLAVILGLLNLKGVSGPAGGRVESLWEGLSGVRIFVAGRRQVFTLLILASLSFFFGQPYLSLIPVFARDILGVGPEGFGLMLTTPGVGGILASLWQAGSKPPRRPGLTMLVALILFGLLLTAFSFSIYYILSLMILFLAGVAQQTVMTMNILTLQTQIPAHLRGRVMSLYYLVQGLGPVGSLLVGVLGSWLGAPWALGLMGGALVLATLTLWSTRPDFSRFRPETS